MIHLSNSNESSTAVVVSPAPVALVPKLIVSSELISEVASKHDVIGEKVLYELLRIFKI